jgi:hypothetical protein
MNEDRRGGLLDGARRMRNAARYLPFRLHLRDYRVAVACTPSDAVHVTSMFSITLH